MFKKKEKSKILNNVAKLFILIIFFQYVDIMLTMYVDINWVFSYLFSPFFLDIASFPSDWYFF